MQKTTFIIGAGASKDWGFPLGSELNDQIRSWLDDDFGAKGGPSSPIAEAISVSGLRDEHVIAGLKLRDGLLGASSIDRLLHARNDDSNIKLIGKIGIAASILEHEKACALYGMIINDRNSTYDGLVRSRQSWLAIILNYLCYSLNNKGMLSAFERVHFVVFNYDRTIEQYIFHALLFIFDQTIENAKKSLIRYISFMFMVV